MFSLKNKKTNFYVHTLYLEVWNLHADNATKMESPKASEDTNMNNHAFGCQYAMIQNMILCHFEAWGMMPIMCMATYFQENIICQQIT